MMAARLRLWWQKKRKLPVAIGLITLIGVFLLIFAGYWFKWSWTGLNEQVGPSVQQYQPAKTLWDKSDNSMIPQRSSRVDRKVRSADRWSRCTY